MIRQAFFFLLLLSQLSSAQTMVSGGIFSSQTWDTASSPYIVTGDVLVYAQATLSIQPGVLVRFLPGTKLTVQGRLKAIGTQRDSIFFTSNDHLPARGAWEGILMDFVSELNMKYVRLSHSENGIGFDHLDTNSYITRCRFTDNTSGISHPGTTGSGLAIDSTDFVNNASGISAWQEDLVLTHCLFRANDIGAEINSSTIDSCIFIDNLNLGLSGYADTIRGCEFYNNGVALQQGFSGGNDHSVMRKNIIMNNDIGLRITGNYPRAVFKDNVVCGNTTYNIINTSTYSGHDLSFNCWCTDSAETISQSIYDARDDASVGLVTFEPYYSGCDSTNMSISDLDTGISTEIYPNPAQNKVFITNKAFVKYDIDTMEGRRVRSGSCSGNIDLTHLPSGVYTLLLYTNHGETYQGKLVKK